MAHTYESATQILLDCTHEALARQQHSEISMGKGVTRFVCVDCWNAHVYARREARKAQLAERPNDCMRCGQKPHTWTLAGAKLCGRCKTAVKQEHTRNLAKAGTLGIFAQGLLVNTDTWAYHHA